MADNLLAKKRSIEIRNSLGLGQSPISDIFTLMESIGIVLFKTPLQNNSLSAIFMQDKRNYLVIINSNKTLGHQIFSAAHELSHYFFDKQMVAGICSVNKYSQNLPYEQLADQFASEFLMPDSGIIASAEPRKNRQGKLDLFDIVFLQQYYKVSWSAILNKLVSLNYINDADEYKNIGITRLTKMLGYDTNLVSKTNNVIVSRKYIELALKCYENDNISKSKLKEYLSDVNIEISDINKIEELVNGGDGDEDK